MSSPSSPLLPSSTHPVRQTGRPQSSLPLIFSSPLRPRLRRLLSSKYQHLAIILLISFDLLSITGDMLIELYQCDGRGRGKGWERTSDGLRIAGVTFSCLFVVELLCCLGAFGWAYVWAFSVVALSSFPVQLSSLLHLIPFIRLSISPKPHLTALSGTLPRPCIF